MSRSDERKLAALVRKNAAKAAKAAEARQKAQRQYDKTLPPATSDEDLDRRDLFSDMKKREF